MEFTDLIGLMSDIALIIAILIGALLAVFIFVQFAPKLKLRILPHWVDKSKGLLLLRLEVENHSRIRVKKDKILLQILEHEFSAQGYLSEWVPFTNEAIKTEEQPKEWHEPIEIFQSTIYINPEEILSVERLHHCPQNTILHIGIQAKVKMGFLGALAAWLRSWDEQWTTTIIVLNSKSGNDDTVSIV